MTLTLGPYVAEIQELMRRFPRQPGEASTDWFDRLLAKSETKALPEVRLPYREPGIDDE